MELAPVTMSTKDKDDDSLFQKARIPQPIKDAQSKDNGTK